MNTKPDQQKGTRFGWCFDDGHPDHKGCRASYEDWNGQTKVCTCPCHEAASGPVKAQRGTPSA